MPKRYPSLANRVIRESRDLDMSPTEFVVLVVLADCADKSGVAYPSLTHIAKLGHICRRTALRTVDALVDRGLVEAERKQGVRTIYRLDTNWRHSDTGLNNTNYGHAVTGDPVSLVTLCPSTGDSLSKSDDGIYIYEPPIEPPNICAPSKKPEPKSTYSKEFETFWMRYPRKKGKRAAYGSWKRLGKSRPPVDTLIAAVDEQKGTKQWRKGFIPNPSTWLNQGRWEDEVDTFDAPPDGDTDEYGWTKEDRGLA